MGLAILKTETAESSKAKMTVAAGFVNIVAGLLIGKDTIECAISYQQVVIYTSPVQNQIIHTQVEAHYPDYIDFETISFLLYRLGSIIWQNPRRKTKYNVEQRIPLFTEKQKR